MDGAATALNLNLLPHRRRCYIPEPDPAALAGEVATALKLVYGACGDEFPAHLCAVVLPASGLTAQQQQQLVYHLREGDAKELKDCLRLAMLGQGGQGGGKA